MHLQFILTSDSNAKIVPLDYALQNGDFVEILTAPGIQAKRDWLGFVKSEKAKTKIRQKLGLKLLPKRPKTTKKILTTANNNVRIAKCCGPLPGEEITGLKTTKRKIVAHKTDCKNIQKIPKERFVALDWDIGSGRSVAIRLQIKARESTSLLPGILNVISSSGAALVSTNAKADKDRTIHAVFEIKIQQASQLEKIMQKIRKLPPVFEANRI